MQVPCLILRLGDDAKAKKDSQQQRLVGTRNACCYSSKTTTTTRALQPCWNEIVDSQANPPPPGSKHAQPAPVDRELTKPSNRRVLPRNSGVCMAPRLAYVQLPRAICEQQGESPLLPFATTQHFSGKKRWKPFHFAPLGLIYGNRSFFLYLLVAEELIRMRVFRSLQICCPGGRGWQPHQPPCPPVPS